MKLAQNADIVTYISHPKIFRDMGASKRLRLLFRAEILKGPGLNELLTWYSGADLDKSYRVLWGRSGSAYSDYFAVAAIPVGKITSLKNDAMSLLRAYWESERDNNGWDAPNFSNLLPMKTALLVPTEVTALARSVWPSFVADQSTRSPLPKRRLR